MELLRLDWNLLLRFNVRMQEDRNALHHAVELGLHLIERNDLRLDHLLRGVGHSWWLSLLELHLLALLGDLLL